MREFGLDEIVHHCGVGIGGGKRDADATQQNHVALHVGTDFEHFAALEKRLQQRDVGGIDISRCITGCDSGTD